MAFSDYDKSFDLVKSSAVIQATGRQGVDEPYIIMVEKLWRDSTGTIKLHKKGEKILIKEGVRQIHTISPKLFTAWLKKVFMKIQQGNIGIKIDGEYLNLRFRDDNIFKWIRRKSPKNDQGTLQPESRFEDEYEENFSNVY